MLIQSVAFFCVTIGGGLAASLSVSDPIAIVAQKAEISPDGSFSNSWESANGITFQETGVLKNAGQKEEAESVQGSASWTAPEGLRVSLGWKADENGAIFVGEHLPTSPPIPEGILRALAWNEAHPEKPVKP